MVAIADFFKHLSKTGVSENLPPVRAYGFDSRSSDQMYLDGEVYREQLTEWQCLGLQIQWTER